MVIKWQKHVGGSPTIELHQNNIVNSLLLIFFILRCGQNFLFCLQNFSIYLWNTDNLKSSVSKAVLWYAM